MKHFKFSLLIVLTLLVGYAVNAQTSATTGLTEQPIDGSNVPIQTTDVFDNSGKWTLGFGLNIIEDDGGGHIFEIYDDASSHFSNPIALSVEVGLKQSLSLVSRLSLNKYKAGKRVSGYVLTNDEEPIYMAFDVTAKYSFRKLLNVKGFDPYAMAGPGFLIIGKYSTFEPSGNSGLREVSAVNRVTFNVSLGLNYWISDEWGVGVDGLARLGKSPYEGISMDNQTQLTFGVFYRFPGTYKFHRNWRNN